MASLGVGVDATGPEWASERLGDLIRRRVRIAEAIRAGDYGEAVSLAEDLVRASHEVLTRIGGGPEAVPRLAMEAALRADYQLATALAGDRVPG